MAAQSRRICETGAKGAWLVMVHGMSQDHRVFSAQVDAFKDRHPILLIDLPGHGLSVDLPGPFGHWELAAQVDGAITAAGIDRCHYWGTHTGAALGLLLATREPARFQALILEGTVLPGHAMPSVDRELQRARETAQTRGMAAARQQWFARAAWFAVMRQRPGPCRAAEHAAMIGQFPGAPWLYQGASRAVEPIDGQIAALETPVLFYNGEHELPDFIAAADRLQALLPNARRAAIAQAGGFPAWEFPEPVNALVAEFLTAVTCAAS
ncbi:MAG: alpha/beta hydrolase [Proteobacteria bacterium]|nr:alpha/beta hydrolase [Pseudomonadota bacterium]